MPVVLKSPAEIVKMRAAGKLAAEAHEALRELIAPGVTTGDLNRAAYAFITGAGGYPTFLGYDGFTGSICASINEELLHGVPGARELREGDLLKIDIGVTLAGYVADTARVWPVGNVSDDARRIAEAAEACFWACAPLVREGARLGDYAAAAQSWAESRGFGVVREFAGHGVGRTMHEEPSVPNWGDAGAGTRLRSGMTFALEPMLTLGSGDIARLPDGWTIVSADGSLTAHYEHTVAVTSDAVVILTALDDVVI